MDNDVYIPFKLRASQIVGLQKISAKAIETLGIILQAREGFAPEGKNQIKWVAGAKTIVSMYGSYGPKLKALILSIGTTEENPAYLEMREDEEAKSSLSRIVAGRSRAILRVEGNHEAPRLPKIWAIVVNAIGVPIEKLILDELERSDFLQVFGGPSKKKILVGTTILTWPGASTETNEVTVEHNMNVIPRVVTTPSLTGVTVGARGLTTTVFKLKAASPGGSPAAGTTVEIMWFAIA